jgi:hypothetical protein
VLKVRSLSEGLIKENYVEEEYEQEDEFETYRSYRVKVLHRVVSVPSICNL